MTLTPELESKIRSYVVAAYVNVIGSESWERKILLDEIDRLRADLDEQCRLLGMSGEREAKLLGEIERLKSSIAKEREACAKVCDARRRTVSNGNGLSMFSHDPASVEAGCCAEAIRSRK